MGGFLSILIPAVSFSNCSSTSRRWLFSCSLDSSNPAFFPSDLGAGSALASTTGLPIPSTQSYSRKILSGGNGCNSGLLTSESTSSFAGALALVSSLFNAFGFLV
eukprot:TRINITY_DN13073_c0_g1_i3.p1 TRINITY_DN13073_c0_g1~~TRINITY_DN13073_c0_g1_i3.p1  ORF type:complete len:105 (-),score=6.84 TRINITY_DN13073_c0_g1_i3:739-1053(-)